MNTPIPNAPAGRAPSRPLQTMAWLPRACCVALLLHVAACGAAPPVQAPAGLAAAPSAAIWSKVQAELADTACDSAQQCHSSPAGVKACGGPERYVAWSGKHQDGARLRQLLDQYAQARRGEDAAAGMMSTCIFVSDPGATCQAGRCVLQSPAVPPDAQ